MMGTINIKQAEHLVDIILNMDKGMPNYSLFLGAGASWTSGVKTAKEMIETWRVQLYGREKGRIKYKTWLSREPWYDSDDEYSFLFEYLYDEQSQRRDYIEACLKNSHPSWGYVYLASLLQEHIFDSIFTTNFDDLINEACYLYSDNVRPIVCAHDSIAPYIRITRLRPKIFKLHGDFLFDNIKNTTTETDKLEGNMEAKLSQFGQEYGLIVIGYSGRDNSIMSILETLLEKDGFFRHGIYWCMRKRETPSLRVQTFLAKNRVHAIEIEGFDEFMALLHNKARLTLPSTVVNPMKVAEQRARLFCSVPPSFRENDIIRHDIEKVLDGLGKIPEQKDKTEGKYIPPAELPLSVKAAIMRRRGDLFSALEYLSLAVKEDKTDPNCAWEYCEVLARLDRKSELLEFIPSSALYPEENKTFFLLFTNDNPKLIDTATNILSVNPSSDYARINRAIAYKRLNMKPEMNKDLSILEEHQSNEAMMAGIAALRKNKEKMLALLKIALDKNLITLDGIQFFPVFEDYRNDSGFQNLINDIKK